MHWVQIITNEAVPYTYRNLSVDNAFSVLHIQNVYIYIYTVFQRNKQAITLRWGNS